MSKLEKIGKIFNTDVLVIGGGSSGLWASYRAKQFVDSVLLVDKGPRDWGGLASMSGGDFDVVLPGENVEDWVKDLVYYYDGLCEQDVMEEIFKQTNDRFLDYQKFGCEFFALPDGRLKGVPQRGLDHIKLYPAKLKGRGGEDMMQGLLKEVERVGVERKGRTLISDLLKMDGKVVGAVGFDTYSGDFYVFKARAVILATGAGGWKTSYHQNTMTGEGTHMAFKAGADVRNFEFIKIWNVPTQFAWEGQTTLLPLGAKFVNARGEAFMDKYSPILGANTDPHFNVLGMAFEAREGKGPFYFDISNLKTMDIVKPEAGWQIINYQKLVDLGIDFFNQNTEWMPQVDGSFAGLVADINGNTNLPGLFVAGRGRSIDPGVYIGGFALATTAVTGHITGKVAAEYAKSREMIKIDENQVAELKKQLFAPLGKKGISPHETLREIQEIFFPYDVCMIKSENKLKNALDKMEVLLNEILPLTTASDPHYLMKLKEVEAIAFISKMALSASLIRKETRAGHYREDYPDRDDKNWLKWIVARQQNNKIEFRTEPVPFDRYKFKPTRYYMDNFKFPSKKECSKEH